VVFYDPRNEFASFIAELASAAGGEELSQAISVHDVKAILSRFEGSYFALKLAIEPSTRLDAPEPMLVYLPSVERDRHGSVLMEMEKGGTCYEPQLKRLARNVLRAQGHTDGDIDRLLAPDNLTYEDVVRFLAQGGSGQPSVLRVILGEGSSEALLSRWLADETTDADIVGRKAIPELFALIEARFGIPVTQDMSLQKTRHQTLRYVLVNEFRGDLSCPAPDTLAIVPTTRTKDEHQRIIEVAGLLRAKHATQYVKIADGIEAELGIPSLGVRPECLGSIDTFRFEERVLLGHTAELIGRQAFEEATKVVTARGRNFWADRDVGRLAQWEAARLMIELGREIERVKPLLQKGASGPRQWVEAYTSGVSWFEVDRVQRAMESFVAKMDDDLEEPLEKALGVLRRNHENLIAKMAEDFTKALEGGGWTVPGILPQTQVFPSLVEAAGGRTAFFMVDALRYEMGADLARQLVDVADLKLVPAVAAMPSITAVGMAALLPGASASFSVGEFKGKLAASIGESVLAGAADRGKLLKRSKPDAVEIDLGELLQKTSGVLRRRIGEAPLVVVRSQAIDGLGELDGGLMARQIMDTAVGNVARAVRKLAKIGIEYFVVSADHGYQFSLRKEADMVAEKPGGEPVELHRRCWAGRGGKTPATCVRVRGAELGYDTDLDFVFPRGLAVFPAGGSLSYHHGGVSLQEMVIPVLSFRIPPSGEVAAPGRVVRLEGWPLVLTNRTFGMRVSLEGELFVKEPVAVRLVLIAEGQEVGRVGMAVNAELDRAGGVVKVPPDIVVDVAMVLIREDYKKVRIVAQDPANDAILAQSDEITVNLGI
jgi:hypothetical protein